MQRSCRSVARSRSLGKLNPALCLLFATLATISAANVQAIPDTPFVQEYREEVAYPKVEKSNQVRSIAAGAGDTVWIATKVGVFEWKDGAWTTVFPGSAYALAIQGDDVWREPGRDCTASMADSASGLKPSQRSR